MSHRLVELFQGIDRPRILVVGDLILDRYIFGDAERVSQEAPVILLRADREEHRLGGASNVANMIRGLQADATLVGVVGGDSGAQIVFAELERAGINHELVLKDPGRPTTVKERYIGRAQHRHPHQMLRVDREVRDALSTALEDQFIQLLEQSIGDHDCVLISDYAKGVCTPRLTQAVIGMARKSGIPVIVDPHPGSDYEHYRGASGITPNRLETKRATGIEIRSSEDAFRAGSKLCENLNLARAYITMDSDGMALVRADGSTEMLKTRRREVYDITGAGDMVLAMIGLGMASGIPDDDIGRLANVAGGLEVEQVGVVCISREQILKDLWTHGSNEGGKIKRPEDLLTHLEARKKLGHKIVFTNGCFDLLHIGHVSYLQEAAKEGDCLIVALNSDFSVKQLNKGPDRPILGELHRAQMLAALECVDYVTIFNDPTPHSLLRLLKPDVLVKGGTYNYQEIVGWQIVEEYGGTVKPLGVTPGISTTEILNRIRSTANIPKAA